jgi:hypothetical protein
MPHKDRDKKYSQTFGHRQNAPPPELSDPTPSYEKGIVPFLAKRSTTVALVLVGTVAFIGYSASYRQTCTIPPSGASFESMAEYERCRSRHTSSGGHSSSSWYSSSGSSSSTTAHSTASRGGFGSTGSAHASGG